MAAARPVIAAIGSFIPTPFAVRPIPLPIVNADSAFAAIDSCVIAPVSISPIIALMPTSAPNTSPVAPRPSSAAFPHPRPINDLPINVVARPSFNAARTASARFFWSRALTSVSPMAATRSAVALTPRIMDTAAYAAPLLPVSFWSSVIARMPPNAVVRILPSTHPGSPSSRYFSSNIILTLNTAAPITPVVAHPTSVPMAPPSRPEISHPAIISPISPATFLIVSMLSLMNCTTFLIFSSNLLTSVNICV